MPSQHRTIYAPAENGGVQLAAGSDRWVLHEDYVDLAPGAGHKRLVRFEAELKPFVDSLDRGALIVIDMQNDFCSPGGWTDSSGLDYKKCREAIPGIRSPRVFFAPKSPGIWSASITRIG